MDEERSSELVDVGLIVVEGVDEGNKVVEGGMKLKDQ